MNETRSMLCVILLIIYCIFYLPSDVAMSDCLSEHETKYACIAVEDFDSERELSYIMSSLDNAKYYLRKRSMLTYEKTYYIQDTDDGVYFGELLVDGNKITSDGKEPQLIDIGSVDKVGDVSEFGDYENDKILEAAEMLSFLIRHGVYNDVYESYEHAVVSVYNEIGILYLDPDIYIPFYVSVEDYEKSIEKL
ncbi:TPA: hypothetical protein NKS78_001523 [Vibrio parahaemolyticus]|nr:hypothetical protein [Vibrio parahaemolyticus]HCM0800471.1 hypothetical protein [Vibrio parahaemolyticus]